METSPSGRVAGAKRRQRLRKISCPKSREKLANRRDRQLSCAYIHKRNATARTACDSTLMTPPPTNQRDTADEIMVGNGFESGFMVIIFALGGYFLDRWLGTTPWFVIGMFVLGAVGLFFKLKASYGTRMDSYENDRVSALSASPRSSDVTT